MKDDAQKALEELEQGLLGSEDEDISLDELLLKADELTGQAPARKEPSGNAVKPSEKEEASSENGEDPLQDEDLRSLLTDEPQAAQEPAFEDPDAIGDLDKAYQNFSNGYGQEQAGNSEASASRWEKVEIGLMFATSALALGVIGVCAYWLTTYLAHF